MNRFFFLALVLAAVSVPTCVPVNGVINITDARACPTAAHDISISAGLFIQKNINELLSHKYNVQHTTLQLE